MNKSCLRFASIAVMTMALACDTEETPTSHDAAKADVKDVLEEVAPDTAMETGADDMPDVSADTGDNPSADTSDTGEPLPYLSARKTAVPLDMVYGDNAYGIRGKSWVLENSRVRFVFQDAGISVHLNVYGGNLLDADRRREPGEDGNDQFREFFPLVGFRVNGAASVEVVNDGSDGKKAVLRVTGNDKKMGVLDVIDNLASDLGAIIRTDYILEPDVPWLKVRTEIENTKNTPIDPPILVGDFVSFGGAVRVFRPEGGFTGEPIDLSALVTTGRGASYGYTVGTGMITVPYQELNSAITVIGGGIAVPAKAKASYDRYLVVGKGDVASVLDSVQSLRSIQTDTLSGTVTDEAGGGLAGAWITVFKTGEADPAGDGKALTQAATDSGGGYSLDLPPGSYDVVASAEGRLRVMKENVDITQFNANFQMDAAGEVGLDIQERDEQGDSLGHIPAKVSFECLDGGEAPWAELNESESHGQCDVLFTANGGGQYPVKPGHYKVVVSRGIEYESVTIDDLEVKAGETIWIEQKLLRSLDTTGYLSGDFHQHTLGSIDAEVTHVEKVIENLAEGVEVAAITDHDNITSYEPAISSLGAWDRITSVTGDEVTHESKGHFNMFQPDGEGDALYPYLGAKLYSGKSIPALLTDLLAISGVEWIQMNHPRSYSAYLSWIRYDPVAGTSLSTEEAMGWDFHSIEVQGSLGTPDMFTAESDAAIQSQAKYGSSDIPVLRDWFSMLNMGNHLCAMGNSDSHNRNDGVGYSRNFLRVGTDKPSEVTFADLLAAVFAQRNVVSNGPFLRLMVKEPDSPTFVERMGHAEMVKPVGGDVTVDLTVTAASWVDVSRMEVYANGRPLHLIEVAGVLLENEIPEDTDPLWVPIPLPNTTPTDVERLRTMVHLYPKVDTWYVFLVRGGQNLTPVGMGTPYAYTNPLYVDADGDGVFTPPM